MLDKETVAQIKVRLAALPARSRPLTTTQAIAALAGEIAELRNRGYSETEICAELGRDGIKASVTTLRRALRGTRAARGKQASTSRRPRSGATKPDQSTTALIAKAA